jgi:hypothetical protein
VGVYPVINRGIVIRKDDLAIASFARTAVAGLFVLILFHD